LEALHLALASPRLLMRILSQTVLAKALLVASTSPTRLCRAIGAQFIGHDNIGCETLLLEQLAHQFLGCGLVAPSLHEDIENLAFVVDRAPEPAGPQSSRPSRCHRAVGRGLDGEVLGQTSARTSLPIAAPFQRSASRSSKSRQLSVKRT
jgi:hypothetical protein